MTENKHIPSDLDERSAKMYLIMRTNLSLLQDTTGRSIRNTILNDYYLELIRSQKQDETIEDLKMQILESGELE